MTISRRRLLQRSALAAGAAALGPLPLAGTGLAAAPKAGVQAPGFYRFSVGSFEVTALLDGYLDAETALIPELDSEKADRLAADQFRRLPAEGKQRLAVNCFVINTGEKLVLVDSGTADHLGPTLGQLPANLKAAGIAPEAIDAILLTHMHLDHIAGIADKQGKALFPNAEVIAHKAEWDFWNDDGIISQGDDFIKNNAQITRAMVAPYQKRLTLFERDRELLPGISAMALPGHTPGHTGFLLQSDGQQALLWGDIIHFTGLQFAHPEWSLVFDVDQARAEETRRRLLDRVAADRIAVAGAHLDFPALGHVARERDSYRYYPSRWQYQI